MRLSLTCLGMYQIHSVNSTDTYVHESVYLYMYRCIFAFIDMCKCVSTFAQRLPSLGVYVVRPQQPEQKLERRHGDAGLLFFSKFTLGGWRKGKPKGTKFGRGLPF